ncbi:hypothetical protein R3P38DRAFT_3575979, partial [Favolaschia claudopus]
IHLPLVALIDGALLLLILICAVFNCASSASRVPVSDSALLIIIHADAHSSSSRTRAFIIYLCCYPSRTAHSSSSMRTRTHLHRGHAPSSSICCYPSRTAHSIPCGRALIFIADARPHHLSAAAHLRKRTSLSSILYPLSAAARSRRPAALFSILYLLPL